MIKSRVYYIVWLLASLLLYLWSDSWIACFLVAVSVILPLVSGLWLLTEKRQIHCYFQIKDIAGKGQEAKGSLCVENHGFLPLPRLGCHLVFQNRLTGEKARQDVYCSVSAKKTQQLEWGLSSEYCGNIRVVLETISCSDVFGLWKVVLRPGEKSHVVILPDIIQMEVTVTDSDTANWESVTYSSGKRGDDPSEIFGVREYLPGDSLKNIHWKLSGKMDDLYVKELSLPIENSILLIYETAILGKRRESARVRSAMMEAFLSVSQALAGGGHVHALGWYDQEKERFCCENVASEDDLTGMIGGLLALASGRNDYSSLHYYLREYIEKPFAHIVYVTAQEPGEELKRMMEFCSVCVLHCREGKDGKENTAGEYTVFSPDTMEESLYQLLV